MLFNLTLSLRVSIKCWVELCELLPAWHDGVWRSQGDERMGYDWGSETQQQALNTEIAWLAEEGLELEVVGG